MKKLPEKVEIALTEKLDNESLVLKSFDVLDIIESYIYQNAYIRAICGSHCSDTETVMLVLISWDKDHWNKEWYQINLINLMPRYEFNVFNSLLSVKEAMPYEPSDKEQAADPFMV